MTQQQNCCALALNDVSLHHSEEPGSLVAVLGHDGHLLILPLGVKAAGQERQAELLCDGLDLQGIGSGAVRRCRWDGIGFPAELGRQGTPASFMCLSCTPLYSGACRR